MPDKGTTAKSVQQDGFVLPAKIESKTVSKAHIRGDMTTIAAESPVDIDYREAGGRQI